MKVVQAICTLLDIDVTHQQAKDLAIKRLKQLNINGEKCIRCDGLGVTHNRDNKGIPCYPCGGSGYIGYGLTRIALKTLKFMHRDGQLDRYRAVWQNQAHLQSLCQSFDDKVHASNIVGIYSPFWAAKEVAGGWNHDLQLIHREMKKARRDLMKELDPALLKDLSLSEQATRMAHCQQQYTQSMHILEALLCEVDLYCAWHAKPDFKALCFSLVRT
ncbi:hypothetical protein [Pseudoalteromonas umbrosa]|uniref:hypothetical protein n=1 Tax=Pseudoalteromonas umbrosa TaxID=3048489 RepID=UPI0024C36A0B|nr:hypothetical protein [Pseudoalteromonas sp. B95]MDK1290085.1 hypothetical protein [Pseudoalteromonas sp. B95]